MSHTPMRQMAKARADSSQRKRCSLGNGVKGKARRGTQVIGRRAISADFIPQYEFNDCAPKKH
jgi:hypothetical protein